MKISIITTTYNSSGFVRDAIMSVISQTWTGIEYIIIDGGSSDNTLEIIEEYKPRIAQVISEPDKGRYDAMNKGIKLATGDVIGFLHSDDIFESDQTIEKIADCFEKKHTDLIYGDCLYVSKKNTDMVIRRWKSKSFVPEMLRKGWMPPHTTIFAKREVYEKFGLYNLSYRISADYDWIVRLFSSPGITSFYLPQIITRMRVGGISNSGLTNFYTKRLEDYCVIRINRSGNILTLLRKNLSKLSQFFLFTRNP